jgi:hypothetical protein
VSDGHGGELEQLAADLTSLRFDLSGAAAADLRTERDRLVRLLRGVQARTAEPRAPLLVVVGGGSGAGKSTTVNSLARRAVAATGVVRPTTRVPTLVCHPEDRAWFADERILPDLVRVPVEQADAGREPPGAEPELAGRQLRLAVSAALPLGVAVLDTPDIDSVALANHVLADESLDAADAWVWLATSRSYADEVGMTYLRRASARQALTVVAITQVRPHERDEVLADVARLLADERVPADARLEVPFATVTDGQLPEEAIAPLRGWLEGLAPTDRRVQVRARALAGLRAAVPGELAGPVAAAERELEVADRLTRSVDARFNAVSSHLEVELDAGLSLRSEVLDRWHQLVGRNEALSRVQTTANQIATVLRAKLGQPTRDDTRQVQVEVADELTRAVTRLLEGAARAARNDLETEPPGRDVLDRTPALRHDREDRQTDVRHLVADWESSVAEQVERVGAPRTVQARRTTTAINAVATSAILVLFALSGGITGGEVGIAAAAAGASQWLLLKLFGEHNLRQLMTEIREDLLRRVDTLAREEAERFTGPIANAAPSSAVVAALRQHAGSRVEVPR